MSTEGPRVLALTGVALAHAGVLLLLVTLTRTHLVRDETESPVLFVLLAPKEPQRNVPGAAVRRPQALRTGASAGAAGSQVPPSVVAAPRAAIDWAAEAAAAAARGIGGERERRRQATVLAPVPSAIFAVRPKSPQFHWDSARTHRLEGFPVFATVVHLNERCTLVLFVIIPMGGCALGEIPGRADLFAHMRDPEEPAGLP